MDVSKKMQPQPAGPGPTGPSAFPSPVPQPNPTGMVVPRERLHALVDARLPGAVWLHGPTGAGKTMLLRSWLQRQRAPSIWLTVDERHREPAALFAAFTTAAATHGPGRPPVFSPEHRDATTVFARDYFERLDALLPGNVAIVVDDVHHLVGTTAPLLACAIDAFGGRRRLCFASQLMPDATFAPQLAGSRLWIVGHRQLAFDVDEARALAERIGAQPAMLDALVEATDGWAAGLMLAMQFGAIGGGGDGSEDPLAAVRTPLALLIAGQVLGGVERDALVRLRLLAELPQVPMDLVDLAPDWADACARLQTLAERGLFVERLAADRGRPADGGSGRAPGRPPNVTRLSKGCWRLHDLFRSALREPGAVGPPDEAIGTTLVAHLLSLDRLDLAWQLAARLGVRHLERLAASHGAEALRDPHLPGMLQLAQPYADRTSPSLAVWQARALLGSDDAAALRVCDEAFIGHETAGDANGAALVIALALLIVFVNIENVGAITTWAERFVRVPRALVVDGATDDEQALRLAGEVVHDLLVGGRSAGQAADDALQDRLMTHVMREALPADETLLAGSLLVSAMRRSNRIQEVELAIVRIESLASFRRSAPHIRASWNVENGYHFSRFGLPDRARSSFAAALDTAEENALLLARITALIGLVRLELASGGLRRAHELLLTMESIGQERLGRQRGWVVHLRARHETLSGRPAAALDLMRQAERLIDDAGFPDSTRVILDHDRIQMLHAQGDHAQSERLGRDLIARCSASDARRVAVTCGLLAAHRAHDGDRAVGDRLCREHLEAAQSLDMLTFVNLLPEIAAHAAAQALRLGIATEFVNRAIRSRQLPAPRRSAENWPWPLRIEVLRPFRIVRDGETLVSSGKAQQKPLELLKYLASQRDPVADAATVANALWPDAEEGAARKSLEVTISRLRKLLGDDTLVLVKEGKVALDAARVSSDAREAADAIADAEGIAAGRHDADRVIAIGERLLRLFGEPPLEHEEPSAWREGVRERSKASFMRAARTLIAYWEQAGDTARATTLIEAALAREPLSEHLYRLLMQIHLDAGDPSEAMRVYRQCRQMLSVLIGVPPSSETERLKSLIPF